MGRAAALFSDADADGTSPLSDFVCPALTPLESDQLPRSTPASAACPRRLNTTVRRWTVEWQLQGFLIENTLRFEFVVIPGRNHSPVGFHRIESLDVDILRQSLNAMNARTWSSLSENFSGMVSLSLTQLSFSNNVSSLARIIISFSTRTIRARYHESDNDRDV
jgi:hypothetical protein